MNPSDDIYYDWLVEEAEKAEAAKAAKTEAGSDDAPSVTSDDQESNDQESKWEKFKYYGTLAAAGIGTIFLLILEGLSDQNSGGEKTSSRYNSHRNVSDEGGSVWTVGGGGKKPGSWSSGRHK